MPESASATPTPFDPDAAWDLHPRVSVRPEAFGALLYHFGTRRLSFLKDRMLLDVVRALGAQPTARDACTHAGVPDRLMPRYDRALAALAAGGMVVPRSASAPAHEGAL